ncbi:MAG: peptide ABC transporter substrate-binding protein [Negativicutes bacterium]|nr:peptide ABC transporter substrate-binding protein [Negativicutes bacterium]
MVKRKIAVIMIFFLIGVGFLGGCSWFGSKSGPKYLRYAVGAEPETIDPRKSTSLAASTVEGQIFEGLTAMDGDNKIVPAAAERWEVSPDGLKYVFYLRPGAKWSNGEPVTAQDFEFAWKSTLSPELASSYAYQLFYLKNGEAYNTKKATADQVGVKAIGDSVLEVVLEKPTPYFLSLTAFHTYYPVNQKLAANGKWASDPKTIVGNGPFKLVNWVHDNKMEFVKNENYWDVAKVRMAKLDFILVDSTSTVLTMFENGQLDMAENLPTTEIPRLLKEGKLKIFPFLATYYYTFNVSQPPFDNPKVRKAFSLAIDRQSIINRILQAEQKPAQALVPFGLPDTSAGEDFRVKGGDYFKDNDVEAAKKLLTEAGYPEGRGLPPVTLLYNTSESHKMIAEAVQEMWKKNLGVTVQLSNQEWKVFLDNLDKRNYQVARDSWIGDYADAMTFIDLFESEGGNNTPGYKNPAYDALVNTAKGSADQAVRVAAMHQAEKMLLDDAVVAPIYFYTNPVLVKDSVKGYARSILGTVYFKEAYIE